jgi:hypothetical protein
MTEVSAPAVTAVQIEKTNEVPLTETAPQEEKVIEEIEDVDGPIKRKK